MKIRNIEFEFTVLNNISLVRLASYMYQYLKDKQLLEDFTDYLKQSNYIIIITVLTMKQLISYFKRNYINIFTLLVYISLFINFIFLVFNTELNQFERFTATCLFVLTFNSLDD